MLKFCVIQLSIILAEILCAITYLHFSYVMKLYFLSFFHWKWTSSFFSVLAIIKGNLLFWYGQIMTFVIFFQSMTCTFCIKIISLWLLTLFSHPEPYKAYFLANSDPEFCVTPQTGELLPRETNGSLIQVDFLPTVYGKLYQGKLIVQVGAKAVCTWTDSFKAECSVLSQLNTKTLNWHQCSYSDLYENGIWDDSFWSCSWSTCSWWTGPLPHLPKNCFQFYLHMAVNCQWLRLLISGIYVVSLRHGKFWWIKFSTLPMVLLKKYVANEKWRTFSMPDASLINRNVT